MQRAPLPDDEAARLHNLCQYQILDSEPEGTFDDLTRLAASICATPMALISLVDSTRQWFKSRVGVSITSTARDIAFCRYTIGQTDVLIVPDALADERFATNPLVTDEPNIRFYAGAPLVTPDAHTIGTICVIDTVPRELSSHQTEALRTLSRQVVAQLELRRKLIELEHLTQTLQHSEAAVRESEERFRTIANVSPMMIWMDDVNKQAIFYNQTWLQFTGRSLEQELGEGWQQSLHPDDWHHWLDNYNTAFEAQEPYTIEYRLRRRDGEYCWIQETGIPRFLSNRVFAGFTGSCIDITDRKLAEEDRRLLQSVTQAIVTSPDFHSAIQVAIEKVCEATQWEFGEAWVPNLDKTVMECSPAWYSTTADLDEFRQQSVALTFPPGVGIPGRVWISKQTEWHQDVSLETTETYLRAQLALTVGLKATLGIPLIANDEVITVLVFYMFEARQEDERLIDLITASTELGLFIQRKQAEEEVRKSLAKEQELNQFKSNFIASLSHELRTPLTSVLGLSDVLLQQHFGPINAKQEQYLSMIHDSGDHLLKLINDLLDLTKIESGKQELYKEEVDVEQLCRDAISIIKVRAVAKQQSLLLQLPLPVQLIKVDRQRVLQILLNYLSNAVKFTPAGGTITLSGRVSIELELESVAQPVRECL